MAQYSSNGIAPELSLWVSCIIFPKPSAGTLLGCVLPSFTQITFLSFSCLVPVLPSLHLFFFFQVAPYLGLCSGRSSTALVLAQRAQTSLVPPGFTTMARQGLWNSSYFQKSPVHLATLGFSSPSNEPCALLWCHRSEA